MYYELLKPGKTVNTKRYRQQMINLNHARLKNDPKGPAEKGKVILLYDNATSTHTARPVKDTMKLLG